MLAQTIPMWQFPTLSLGRSALIVRMEPVGFCTGIGSRMEIDPSLVIPNGRLTIAEGAIQAIQPFYADAWYMKKLQAMADKHGFSLHVPTGQLKKEDIERIVYGTGDETL